MLSIFKKIILARKSNNARRTGAIFVTSHDEPRIRAHFHRLQEQSEDLLDVSYIVNTSRYPEPECSLSYASPKKLMPLRMQRMMENGGMYTGFVDVLFVPLAMATKKEFVWFIEYDVDFSGDWRSFFRQFEADRSDLLTTTLRTRAQSVDWYHWHTATPPAEVPHSKHLRSFNPIMRLSRRFLEAYVQETARHDWQGHTEYIIPTIAAYLGFAISDIGGTGEYCPKHRRSRNYTNSSEVSPGTLVYRPSRPAYFNENAADFLQPDMLYHPVKVQQPGN